MAVIASNYFYAITNNSHFHIQTQRKFQFTSKFSNLSHHRKSFLCQSSSNYEAEEQRWLREEQRWLREEQRWLREEARWNIERQSLLRQISELSLQIQHLQEELDNLRTIRSNSSEFDIDFEVTLTKMAKFLETKKNLNQIPDFSDKKEVDNAVKTRSLDDVEESVSSVEMESEKKKEKRPLSSSSLKVGAEGEEVRALQEALMELGFYSGEEDIEYSSFSGGTERAVKTWQASIGVREDGIMTVELLEQLHSPKQFQSSSPSGSSTNADTPKDEANGAPVTAKEIQKTVEQKSPPDVEISHNRVFLLGENRWEEPSRLNKGNDKLGSGGKAQSSAPKCLVCRGEGRLMCIECDGTGEPNIEEQFLDWVEDGAKCPYCEGLGYTVCDVCRGKSAA